MLIIQNGTVIDPNSGKEPQREPVKRDIWIDEGKIVEAQKEIPSNVKASATVIDAKDCWVVPGLLDIHAETCDPGYSSQETIHSASRAAAFGGFTSICATSNTKPVADCKTIIEYVKGKAKSEAVIDILQMACLSKGMEGKEITDLQSLYDANAVAFFDSQPYSDLRLLKLALQYTACIGATIISNPENTNLSNFGVMNDGEHSLQIGLKGIGSEAETTAIASQIEILREVTKTSTEKPRLHFSAVSCATSVAQIERAKNDGLAVTAATTTNHLILTDRDIDNYNTAFKTKPPFRTEEDREALKQAIKNGVIDAIASHHSPRTKADKSLLFEHAAYGISSLETSFHLFLDEFVKNDIKQINSSIKLFSSAAANCLNLQKSFSLEVGQAADVIIVNPNLEWVYSKENSLSQSSNTPLIGKKFRGKVTHTIKNGEVVQT